MEVESDFFYTIKTLPHRPELLFNLVLSVEDYPKFLPWCQAARVISFSTNQQQIIAELVIKFKTFVEKYQSRIAYITTPSKEYIIDVQAISGPFKYLNNKWKFYQKTSETSVVEFIIDLQFKSSLLDKLMPAFFDNAVERMIESFEARALSISQASVSRNNSS